jgi:tRNA (adenine57-N1/adenine58-N1)-methyltransferase
MYSVVRDVCEKGFDLIDAADAVFLDLPHPWKVVPHAKIALKVSIIRTFLHISCYRYCVVNRMRYRKSDYVKTDPNVPH